MADVEPNLKKLEETNQSTTEGCEWGLPTKSAENGHMWNQTKKNRFGDISCIQQEEPLSNIEKLRNSTFQLVGILVCSIWFHTLLWAYIMYIYVYIYGNSYCRLHVGTSFRSPKSMTFYSKTQSQKKTKRKKYKSIYIKSNKLSENHSNTNAPQLIISEYITQPNTWSEAICSVFSLSLVHGKPWLV